MSTQETAALIESVNQMTATVAGKMGQIDQKVAAASESFEGFKANADNRYALQKRITKQLRVEGNQNFWYPVRIGQPNGANFYLRRHVHQDSAVYGQWNGALEFHFRANDREYGANFGYILVDMYLVDGKSTSRVLPDADIPFIGKLSTQSSPYDVWIWLRGNTTYEIGADFANVVISVYYEAQVPIAGYSAAAPIPITDGVHVGVPAVGYIRGEVNG
ncbi:hypothetical protein AAEH95_08950 [Shewanella xiamenensis]|uniref:hypothetical protein n=1 Tax=Shewanella xiamenensis TaxID=332186 RepID=UPI00313B8BC2